MSFSSLLGPQNKSLLLEGRNEVESTSLKVPLTSFQTRSMKSNGEKRIIAQEIKYRGGGSEKQEDETQIQKGIRVMREFLVRANPQFYLQNIENDGNCLYRAIEDQLEGTQSVWEKYKNLVLHHIEENKSLFEGVCKIEYQNVEQYIQKARKTGAWGSEIEIRALERACNLDITLFEVQTDTKTGVTELRNFNLCDLGYPVGKTKSSEKPTFVRIGFVAKCHYVSIKELPLETASKKVVEMKKKEILKTIPRETLEHFKETYGEKDLTLKKNGDLSWRSSRNKELLNSKNI